MGGEKVWGSALGCSGGAGVKGGTRVCAGRDCWVWKRARAGRLKGPEEGRSRGGSLSPVGSGVEDEMDHMKVVLLQHQGSETSDQKIGGASGGGEGRGRVGQGEEQGREAFWLAL